MALEGPGAPGGPARPAVDGGASPACHPPWEWKAQRPGGSRRRDGRSRMSPRGRHSGSKQARAARPAPRRRHARPRPSPGLVARADLRFPDRAHLTVAAEGRAAADALVASGGGRRDHLALETAAPVSIQAPAGRGRLSGAGPGRGAHPQPKRRDAARSAWIPCGSSSAARPYPAGVASRSSRPLRRAWVRRQSSRPQGPAGTIAGHLGIPEVGWTPRSTGRPRRPFWPTSGPRWRRRWLPGRDGDRDRHDSGAVISRGGHGAGWGLPREGATPTRATSRLS